MKKKILNKKSLIIIITILIAIILIVGTIFIITKDKETSSNEDILIKESELTLDELYAIVEDPELFYEKNYTTMTTYNVIMFHFYNYFSRSTPVKIATKVRKNENNKVIEVLEVEYISYDKYHEYMTDAYAYEKLEDESYEQRNKKYNQNAKPSYNYAMWIERLVYGHAEVIEE